MSHLTDEEPRPQRSTCPKLGWPKPGKPWAEPEGGCVSWEGVPWAPQFLCHQMPLGALSSSATRDSPEGPLPRSGSHSPSPRAWVALRFGLGQW